MVYHDLMLQSKSSLSETQLDLVYGALSNSTRRSLLVRLTEGDAFITELAAPFKMSLPAVSKHLGVLEDAGLITRKREGKSRRCALLVSVLDDAESWIAARRVFWTENFESLAAFVERERDDADAQDPA